MSLKIGVVGSGVVGGALVTYLDTKTKHSVFVLDPGLEMYGDLTECDIVFISVPVPCKGFKQDLSILYSAIESVPEGMPIIIRSTILPGTCEALTDKYKRSFSHLPEFLTARRAVQDLIESRCVYLGLPELSLKSAIIELIDLVFPEKFVITVDAKEAEMLKYAHNLHGAMKVTYWNIIEDLCRKENISYETVRSSAIHSTGLISNEHTLVPGPDGKRGFGGTCFPVNLENFIGYTRDKNPLASKFFEDAYCLNRIFRGIKETNNEKIKEFYSNNN